MGEGRQKFVLAAVRLPQLRQQRVNPLLILFAVGDVADECAKEPSGRDLQGMNRQFDREFPAIAVERGQLQSLVEDWTLAGCEESANALTVCFSETFWQEEFRDFLSQRLFSIPAKGHFGLRVPVPDFAVGIHRDDRVQRGLDEQAATLVHFVQGRVRLFAGRDIDNRTQHKQPFFRLHGVQTDFDGKLTRIFSQPIEFAAHSHSAGRREREKANTMLGVLAAESFRYQDFDRLAEELRARIPEQLFGLDIDKHHQPGVVDHHDRGGGGFHGRSKTLFEPFAGGDVAESLGFGDHPTIRVLNRRDCERDLYRLTISSQTNRVVLFDGLTHSQTPDDFDFLGSLLCGNEKRDLLPDGLLGRVTKQPFGRGIPTLDRAL